MMLGEMVSCPFSNKQKLIIIWFVMAKTCQPFNHILILIKIFILKFFTVVKNKALCYNYIYYSLYVIFISHVSLCWDTFWQSV